MNKKDLYRKLVREEELTKEEAKSLGDTRKANLDLPFKYIIRGDKYLGAPVYSEGLKNIATICSSKNNLVAKVSNRRERNFLTFLLPFFSKFFFPEDLDERNVVIERRTNKIFYIDFELWKIK